MDTRGNEATPGGERRELVGLNARGKLVGRWREA